MSSELDSFVRPLSSLIQAKTLFETSHYELTTKLNRLQVDFDATKQFKQQLELKCKELKESEKKDKDKWAEEKKTRKADKSKDGEFSCSPP